MSILEQLQDTKNKLESVEQQNKVIKLEIIEYKKEIINIKQENKKLLQENNDLCELIELEQNKRAVLKIELVMTDGLEFPSTRGSSL